MPAAQETGLPPKVVPWAPTPQRCWSSRRLTIAPMGMPLHRPWHANDVGTMSAYSKAHILPVRAMP